MVGVGDTHRVGAGCEVTHRVGVAVVGVGDIVSALLHGDRVGSGSAGDGELELAVFIAFTLGGGDVAGLGDGERFGNGVVLRLAGTGVAARYTVRVDGIVACCRGGHRVGRANGRGVGECKVVDLHRGTTAIHVVKSPTGDVATRPVGAGSGIETGNMPFPVRIKGL